jgi:hypothetical protein
MWTVATAFPELRGDVPLRERRRRHLIELGVLADDPDDDEEDHVTTTEVAELNGSAVAAATEPAPHDVVEPERRCRGCGTELRGKAVQVWCSSRCRKASTRGATKAQLAARSSSTRTLAPAAQVELQTDLFTQATALAALLPVGAHLERTAGEICLRWPA